MIQLFHRCTALLFPLLLVLSLSLLVGVFAYQAPPEGNIKIGWLGDRLFLDSHSGLGQEPTERGVLYPDELTPDSPTGRSRWTRQRAIITFPNLGTGLDLQLRLLAQGWPDDVIEPVVAQPVVNVFVGETLVGSFVPTPHWQEHALVIPAAVRAGDDLTLRIETSAVFTDTGRYVDQRPKGIRLAEVKVHTQVTSSTAILFPAWDAVLLLVAVMLLFYMLLTRFLGQGSLTFVLATLGAGLAGAGLALIRIWMGAALSVVLLGLLVAIIPAWQNTLIELFRALLRRYSHGRALGYGLVTAALAWLGYNLALFSQTAQLPQLRTVWQYFPDALMYGLLSTGLLALTFVLGRRGLPSVSNGIVQLLGKRRESLFVLALFGAVWLGYQASVILNLSYVGHADYADNAVVARNLVAGRGWVVDYVTQFYRLYEGVTRPQETWPLLQPVWIAPFFALFGPESWAAKLPNLVFNVLLLALVYQIGARIWDRRVGLLAAIFTLTNYLFFRLTIYVTSDLAFVVFSLAAIALLFWSQEAEPRTFKVNINMPHIRLLIGSGICTGLMMLQKPSGAIIAVGMGLWLLRSWLPDIGGWIRNDRLRVKHLGAKARQFLLWATVALAVLSPYIVRNMAVFDKPVYSTESHDAWVLGYRGTRGEAWEDIYRVYVLELGGPGVPDRSWILRWGFDYTTEKFVNQVTALRDYLLPPWAAMPGWLEALSSHPQDASNKNLMMPLGAWLSFIGFIVALRLRRRLFSLLVFAFGPYMLFMSTYWRTDEERYWVMLVPWLALLAAWMIWAGFHRLAAIGDGRWSPLGLILVVVATVGVLQPSWPDIAQKVRAEPSLWQPDLIAYEWIRENTEPGAVMMTRTPWQLNWHTERPAVMIPNTSQRELLLYLANYYNAEYLVLENLLRVKSDAAENLNALLRPGDIQVGDTIEGFTLVYASPTADNRVFIYRFPPLENRALTPPAP
jgi:4-amino-4-deoxy-L-arabinose transferase-like glycosyltransferase